MNPLRSGDTNEHSSIDPKNGKEDKVLNHLTFETFLKNSKKQSTAGELILSEIVKDWTDNPELPPFNEIEKSEKPLLSPMAEVGSCSTPNQNLPQIELPKIRQKSIGGSISGGVEVTPVGPSEVASKPDEPLVSLQSLSDFLDCIFQNRRPARKLSMNKHELIILKSIIKRKFGNLAELLHLNDTHLNELYSKLQDSSSNKRPEENYKFIFKRCLKHMKEKFKEENQNLAKRKDLDRCFYEHYFRSVSDSLKISIDNFYHPKNSKSKNKNGPKTINNTYIQNICKSKNFKKDFSEYLDRSLLREYQESIKLKIKNLITRWVKEIRMASDKNAATTQICAYIEKNKKCKLPWSVKEVSEAIRSVNALFEIANTKTN